MRTTARERLRLETRHRNYNESRHRLILNGTADEASNDRPIVRSRIQVDVFVRPLEDVLLRTVIFRSPL